MSGSLASEAVHADLRQAILSGELAPGDAVPSERELSERLSVNQNSPFLNEVLLLRGIGIRFKGVQRRDVEEYCISEGWIKVQIAKRMDISVKSVETYRARLSEKLGFRHRADLVRYALENKLF